MSGTKKTVKIEDCDFFLITVRGVRGTKVRHTDFNVALKEATRLCEMENHEAFVCGVVASVKPVPRTKVVIR